MDLGELGCYYLGRRAVKPGGLTYKQARLYCQHLHPGAGLAQITSRNVQYMLMGAMIHNNFIINIKVESWWLGATDLYEVIFKRIYESFLVSIQSSSSKDNFSGKLVEYLCKRMIQFSNIGLILSQIIVEEMSIVLSF